MTVLHEGSGDEVITALIVSGCYCTEVFDFVAKPLDFIALLVESLVEEGDIHPARHEADASPCSNDLEFPQQPATVISAIGQKGVSSLNNLKHICLRASVMNLACC